MKERGSRMLKFELCSLNDLSLLQEISKQAYEDTFESFCSSRVMSEYLETAFSDDKLTEELENLNSNFYIVYFNDTVIGYIKLNSAPAQSDINDPNSIELQRIYVLKEFQGLGYGKELLDFSIDFTKNKKKEYIWLGVWEKNIKAIRFYEKNGLYRFGKHDFIMSDERQLDFLYRKDV